MQALEKITAARCPFVINLRYAFTAGPYYVLALPLLSGGMLQVHSVELIDAESGTLVAGEIGYTIGGVYTSLTGFLDRSSSSSTTTTTEDKPEGGEAEEAAGSSSAPPSKMLHSSAGTVQLVALGALLRRCGFHFWNLGHPPRRQTATREARMWYKAELGARVYKRAKFLGEWKTARAGEPSVSALHLALPPEGENVKTLLAEFDAAGKAAPAEVAEPVAPMEVS